MSKILYCKNTILKYGNNLKNKANQESGIIALDKLLGNTKNTIKVDTVSLDDIYLRPDKNTYHFKPRLGSGGILPIPIILSGGIEGTFEAYPKQKIDLYDKNQDKFVKTTQTDAYGDFLFEDLSQGTYYLKINNHMTKNISISLDEAFISDIGIDDFL